MAEWLRSGLQIRRHRFDPGRRLHPTGASIQFSALPRASVSSNIAIPNGTGDGRVVSAQGIVFATSFNARRRVACRNHSTPISCGLQEKTLSHLLRGRDTGDSRRFAFRKNRLQAMRQVTRKFQPGLSVFPVISGFRPLKAVCGGCHFRLTCSVRANESEFTLLFLRSFLTSSEIVSLSLTFLLACSVSGTKLTKRFG